MRSISGSVAHYFAIARGEMRLAFAGAPAFARQAAVFVAWAVTAIVMGSLVGFMAVILPPTAIFVFILLAAVALLWAAPDLAVAPGKLIRRMLLVALVVSLVVPIYYAVQISPLPMISARRLTLFPLIAVFSVALATSPDARQWIASVVRRNRIIALCAFGYPVAAFLSVFTSIAPSVSMSDIVVMILEWYVPFAVTLYVVRNEDDIDLLIRIIFSCALFVSIIGVLDFAFRRNLYLDIMPRPLFDNLFAVNPTFRDVVLGQGLRNGMYRAYSLFNVSLSFAEFEAVIFALAAVFAIYGRTKRDQVFGAVVVLASLGGIYASGSRGGYVSTIVASVALAVVYLIRAYRFEQGSLKPAIVGAIAMEGFIALFGLVLFWRRLHNMVIGNDAGDRDTQWALGIPKVLANPITGHGYGLGAEIVGYVTLGGKGSLDTFLLATLAETGVLGTVCFFGALSLAIWTALRRSVSDRSWQGALMGGLGCSLLAFFTYRLALAQRENMMLMYLLIACVMVLNYRFLESTTEERSLRRSDGPAKLRSEPSARLVSPALATDPASSFLALRQRPANEAPSA